jgi:Flp pilus assembly protein TadB
VKNSNISIYPSGQDALEARIAYRIAARLNERAESVDSDISERLRFAREKAIVKAQAARSAEATHVVSAGPAAVLGGGNGWWVKLGSALPAVALALGLLLIQHLHKEAQISAAAEIDAELLADDIPPAAYSDAGFVEFLKTPRD